MKTYELGLYEKAIPGTLTWREKMLSAKEAGYDFMEMSVDATEEKIARIHMPLEERRDLVELGFEMGVPIRSMCVSALTKFALGSMHEEVRNRGMEIAEGSIALAADLGIRVVMIPGYDVYYEQGTEETKRLFSENIVKVARMAETAGVVVGFETMENEFMNTCQKAMKYVSMIDSPFLQVYPDLGNITNAAVLHSGNVLEDLETCRGHAAALHLKETKPGIFREVPYGEGHVQFKADIRKARELEIHRFVTEFWYTGQENWQEIANENCARFRALLDEVFA